MAESRLTLTEAVFWTKRIGLFTVVGVVLIIFVFIIVSAINGPEGTESKYLVANNACGTDVSPVSLKSLAIAPSIDPIFTLETPDGRVPDLPKVVNLYKYDHPGQSLNALEEATVLAENMGFPETKRIKENDTDYSWTDIKGQREIYIYLDNLNFFLNKKTFVGGLPEPEGEPTLVPSEEDAVAIASQWLQQLGLLTNEYSGENTKTYFLKINNNGTLAFTSARQNADLVRVDFFREKPLILIETDLAGAQNLGSAIQDKLVEAKGRDPVTGQSIDVLSYTTDVVTTNPDKGNLSLTFNGRLLTNNAGETNLWQAENFNWRISETSCGTYALIDPSEAFDKVKNNEGYLVKLQKKFGGDPFETYTPQVVKSVAILDIQLAYLDTRAKQSYLQPVYVLKGDALLGNNTKADIVYYVPALKILYD